MADRNHTYGIFFFFFFLPLIFKYIYVLRFLSRLIIHICKEKESESGLSSALLSRARTLAKEHSALSTRLADSFDTKIAKRVGELAPISKAVREWDTMNEVCILRRTMGPTQRKMFGH